MAKLVLTNSNITIGGTDVSANVASVQIETSVDEVETTAFGPGNGKTRVGGLLDTTISLSMHNDYSVIEGLVYPLIGSTTTIVVKPNGTAVSTANPSYSMTALVTGWSPVNGAVGELASVDISWPVSGTVTKAVA
jgi:hypothetical protein